VETLLSLHFQTHFGVSPAKDGHEIEWFGVSFVQPEKSRTKVVPLPSRRTVALLHPPTEPNMLLSSTSPDAGEFRQTISSASPRPYVAEGSEKISQQADAPFASSPEADPNGQTKTAAMQTRRSRDMRSNSASIMTQHFNFTLLRLSPHAQSQILVERI
jgi:hypothetical protein